MSSTSQVSCSDWLLDLQNLWFHLLNRVLKNEYNAWVWLNSTFYIYINTESTLTKFHNKTSKQTKFKPKSLFNAELFFPTLAQLDKQPEKINSKAE
jgi:hypothetical protein